MKTYYLLLLLSSLYSFQSFAQPDSHLVAHYSFRNGELNNVSDPFEEVLAYDMPKEVPGVRGDALRFRGDDGPLIFTGRTNQALRGRRNFSLSFWFRSDDLRHTRSLMGKRRLCKGIRMFDIRVSDRMSIELYERERPYVRCNVSAMIPDHRWHHYVYVRFGNEVQLYADGRLADKNQSAKSIFIDDAADFAINNSPCIGRDGTARLKGSLDELKVFDTAITSADVRALYAEIRQPPVGNPHKEGSRKKGGTDRRMAKIFGTYSNLGEPQATLELRPKSFRLNIFKPIAYPEYELLVVSGVYKIAGGQILLNGRDLSLHRTASSTRPDRQLAYENGTIVGELYDEVVIDLYAFETRLKLKK